MEKAFNIRHFKDAADYTKNFIVQGEIDRYLPGGKHLLGGKGLRSLRHVVTRVCRLL